MAGVHNALTRAYISKALQAALGVQKTEGGIERYGETMQPVLDLWARPEWEFLREETLFARYVSQAAVAAEFSVVTLANPATSRKLVVIERATAAVGTAGGAIIMAPTTYAAAIAGLGNANVVMRDTRSARGGSQQLPIPEVWFGTEAASKVAGGFSMDAIRSVVANTFGEFTCGVPYILGPGNALLMEGTLVNQSIESIWAGRVRAVLPGEL